MILESELKTAVDFLVCWEGGERILGIFDLHKVKMRRLLDRWAEGKRERKQTEKENKGKKKEESQEGTGLFLGSVYS